jgi:hypothetical protein
MYVPLACTKEEFDPATKKKIEESHYDQSEGWIDGYIDRWLADPARSIFLFWENLARVKLGLSCTMPGLRYKNTFRQKTRC